MKDFSVEHRRQAIEDMRGQFFDLAIIGGGITGAGAARDAASRGLKVALIEAQDFAEGTSSRSSKLIHGGIRYLEQKQFHLVFEALSERQKLFELAPHLVHPLRFVIPLYEGGRVGMRLMGLGMWLYDTLSLWEAPELHERLEPDELQSRFPFLASKGLLGAYAYSDAYMDDDRLVFETLRSAANFGAKAANFVKAIDAELTNGRVTAVTCEDQLTKGRFALRARHFVSTVGPWTDQLGHSLLDSWKNILRPSKGVHLTFSKDRLPLEEAIVMAAEDRIVFGIPRHEMIIIGTTDTDFRDDPAQVRVEPEDVAYLLQVTNRYFPGANVKEEDIVAAYAGVRPLVDDQSQTESGTSREHLILNDPRGITFVAGGKYTTYRHMAEQTVDAVLTTWDLSERAVYSRNRTDEPLHPKVTPDLLAKAIASADHWAEQFAIPVSVPKRLAERHGGEALDILKRFLPELRQRCATADQLFYALEAAQAIDQTMCLRLKDFVFRRTHLFLSEPDHGATHWDFLSRVMAERLGWSDERRLQEINALQKQILFELHWQH